MNRRGFLGGLLAAIAAPAVITTPGLLMPVSTLALPTYGPGGGLLTPEMISAEFNRQMRSQVASGFTNSSKQSFVEICFTSQELTLSLEEYSDRYLRPAAAQLKKTIGRGRLALGATLSPANGVDFQGLHTVSGVSTRMVRTYDIWNDRYPMRLDVLHS